MGSRGPLPKRSEARTRANATFEDGIALKKGVALPYSWPAANEEWHPVITELYEGAQESGMAAYYQQSDVAVFRMALDLLNDEWGKSRRSAMVMAEGFKLLKDLGLTEGERRRLHIELEPEKEEGPDLKVVAMADAKDRLKRAANTK